MAGFAWLEQIRDEHLGDPTLPDYPRSLIAFQRRFPDAAACAAYLTDLRWPGGLRCPACGHDRAWKLETKAWTYECRGCRRQTSLRAGTLLHGSKLPLSAASDPLSSVRSP